MSLKGKERVRREQLLEVSRDNLTCKPLDTFNEITHFLDDPPAWRTLCEELRPRSKYVIRNLEVGETDECFYESADTINDEPPIIKNYCHFTPDEDQPARYDTTKDNIPKTLVCHDMANGYHDDSIMDGTMNYSQYTFYNWAGIDIFCYFSHHLITIPPLGWINVGHAHGVRVIGTVITEWADGVSFWEKILSSTTEYQNFASALVCIAKTMKFDGYLLNIENKVAEPMTLLEFVRHLHELLHKELEHAVLIWYDSVTIEGKLVWQNELNEKNIDFFHACDGFFTNYSWSVEHVERSAQLAGNRVTDLYIGIDIWGRNFFGGGQFNTYEAVKIAFNENCSLAFFAPAWTHEAMNNDPADVNFILKAEGLNTLQRFNLRDRALWGTLWPYLYTHMPCHLPFQTSFCRGQGRKRWMYGEVVAPGPWYNIRHQQYQCNSAHGHHGFRFVFHKLPQKALKVATSSTSLVKKGIIKTPHTADGTTPTDDIVSRNWSDIRSYASITSFIGIKSQNETRTEPRTETRTETRPETQTETHTETQTETQTEMQTKTQTQPVKKNWFKNCLARLLCNTSSSQSKTNVNDSYSAGTSSKEESHEQKIITKPTHPTSVSTESPSKTKKKQNEDVPTENEHPGNTTPPNMEAAALSRTDDPVYTSTTRMSHNANSMITMSFNINLFNADVKKRWALVFKSLERECLHMYLRDGFNGGSSLRINPSDCISQQHRMTRLLHCDFECSEELVICVVTKQLLEYPDQSLNIILTMISNTNTEMEVVLLGTDLDVSGNKNQIAAGVSCLYPIRQREFHDLRSYLLINEPDFYVPIENSFGWAIRYYILALPGSRILSINCRTVLDSGAILLGHLGVCNKSSQNG